MLEVLYRGFLSNRINKNYDNDGFCVTSDDNIVNHVLIGRSVLLYEQYLSKNQLYSKDNDLEWIKQRLLGKRVMFWQYKIFKRYKYYLNLLFQLLKINDFKVIVDQDSILISQDAFKFLNSLFNDAYGLIVNVFSFLYETKDLLLLAFLNKSGCELYRYRGVMTIRREHKSIVSRNSKLTTVRK